MSRQEPSTSTNESKDPLPAGSLPDAALLHIISPRTRIPAPDLNAASRSRSVRQYTPTETFTFYTLDSRIPPYFLIPSSSRNSSIAPPSSTLDQPRCHRSDTPHFTPFSLSASLKAARSPLPDTDQPARRPNSNRMDDDERDSNKRDSNERDSNERDSNERDADEEVGAGSRPSPRPSRSK